MGCGGSKEASPPVAAPPPAPPAAPAAFQPAQAPVAAPAPAPPPELPDSPQTKPPVESAPQEAQPALEKPEEPKTSLPEVNSAAAPSSSKDEETGEAPGDGPWNKLTGLHTLSFRSISRIKELEFTEDDIMEIKHDFDSIDADGDGCITKEETRELLVRERKGGTVSEEEVDNAMSMYDVDHNGQVSFDEYFYKTITM